MAIEAKEDMDQVERHGQAVKRVRSVCDMHRVPFGAVENLDELIASVRDNRHFAMDFWALVGDMSARERGSLSDEETLDVIVEAATGTGAEAVPPGQRAKVEELRQLLAGVDVARPAELPDPIAEPDDALLAGHKGVPRAMPNGVPRQGAPVVVLPDRNSGATKVDPRVHVTVNEDAWVARRSIGEALSRLERTSTELREQLAAIDEQLEQQGSKPAVEAEENHHSAAPEDVPSARVEEEITAREDLKRRDFARGPQPPVVRPEPADWRRNAASVSAAERQREAKIETARQILREWNEAHREPEVFVPRPAHRLSQRGLARPADDDDPTIPVPLSGYAEENESHAGRKIAITALVLAVLGGGGYLFSRTDAGQETLERIRPTLQVQYQGIADRLAVLKREATPRQNTAPSTQDTPQPFNVNANAQAPNGANSTAQSINPASQSDSNVPRAATAGVVQPQPSTTTQAPPVEPRYRRDRESAAAHARDSEIPPEPTGAGMVDDAATVRVPPAVMEANLVASRVPAYPEYARAEGIEGPVVMEAVISKTGWVDHVRVIEGDRHLRSAAEEAVLKWRYRPYTVNGRPVDVATVVRVDFRLHGASHY